MAKDGVQPNTKTFTALISSVGKMSTIEQAMDIINELLSHESEPANLIQTYSALMSACEKAGQWDLAVALFDKMSTQVSTPAPEHRQFLRFLHTRQARITAFQDKRKLNFWVCCSFRFSPHAGSVCFPSMSQSLSSNSSHLAIMLDGYGMPMKGLKLGIIRLPAQLLCT